MWWLYTIIGIIVLLITIVVIRGLLSKKTLIATTIKDIQLDEKKIIDHFIKKIKLKTISYPDASMIDQQAFRAFKDHLKHDYPLINQKATYKEIGTGVLFHIKGQSHDKPIVLMAHFDVVPVSNQWSYDPFGGTIDGEYIYGRGTLDTKITVNAVMESVEYHLSNGKTFKQDIYIAFSGEEEISGPTQKMMVDYFKQQKVTPYMVLDEGGAIVSNMFPGVKQKVAVIGIAEKGFMNISLSATSKGGHASTPPKETPVTILATAVKTLNASKQFKMKMTSPVKALFNHVTPYSTNFFIRMIFSNMWLFKPLIKWIAKLSGGELHAMFKTTLAFTVTEGSSAYNVLPNQATVGINIRLRPDESSEMIVKRIKNIIHNDDISVNILLASEPSTISKMDDGYEMIVKAIQENWDHTIVTPYLMVATTDSKHYHEICDRVYKFAPMDVSKEDLGRMHSDNERMTKTNVVNSVKFYIRLLQQL